eukprot:7315681-Pyramimonas_sp.AAC.1
MEELFVGVQRERAVAVHLHGLRDELLLAGPAHALLSVNIIYALRVLKFIIALFVILVMSSLSSPFGCYAPPFSSSSLF